jgi:hypothetical protein
MRGQVRGAVLCTSLLCACSGEPATGDTSGAGGASSTTSASASTGGAGGTSTTGSSTTTTGTGGGPTEPDVPRGAVSFFFPATPGCPLAEQWLDFPPVPDGHPVTGTEKRVSVEDGLADEEGVQISRLTCTWRPTFAAVGFGYGRSTDEAFVSISPDKVLDPVEKGIALRGAGWDNQYGGLCTFTAIEVDEETRSIWGRVSCEGLETTGEDQSETCVLSEGHYFFENCTLEPP